MGQPLDLTGIPIPSDVFVTLATVALVVLLVVARRRYAWFGPRLLMAAFFGVMFLLGAVYVILGGGPYLVPLLALLLVLALGFALALLPQVVSGRSRGGGRAGEERARAPASWGRAARVMLVAALAALVLPLLADRAAWSSALSLAIGVANVVALAAYGVASWLQRRALPWDRFGSWYYLAIVSCLVVGAGLLGVVKF